MNNILSEIRFVEAFCIGGKLWRQQRWWWWWWKRWWLWWWLNWPGCRGRWWSGWPQGQLRLHVGSDEGSAASPPDNATTWVFSSFPVFIGPESNHCLALSASDYVMLLRLGWCDSVWRKCQLNTWWQGCLWNCCRCRWQQRQRQELFCILGKPSFKKSAVFFNTVQKVFDPPPLSFEHHVVNFFWRNFNKSA